MKITKVQRRVLQVMIDADTTVMVYNHARGSRWSAFFRGPLRLEKNVRVQTMQALERKGLVENTSPPARWQSSVFRITDEGREAVQ